MDQLRQEEYSQNTKNSKLPDLFMLNCYYLSQWLNNTFRHLVRWCETAFYQWLLNSESNQRMNKQYFISECSWFSQIQFEWLICSVKMWVNKFECVEFFVCGVCLRLPWWDRLFVVRVMCSILSWETVILIFDRFHSTKLQLNTLYLFELISTIYQWNFNFIINIMISHICLLFIILFCGHK